MPVRSQVCARGHDKILLGEDKHGRCKTCAVMKANEWNKAHPAIFNSRRRNTYWKYHGILNKDGTDFTCVDYDRQYQIQQGKCNGCGIHQSELTSRLHSDHDHKTGIFRFLLCMNCNRTLGHAQDSPIVLRRLADLLEGK